MNNSVLLVDDEAHVISALKRSISDDPWETVGALSAAEALTLMNDRHFKVVISDERMPGMDGAEFLAIVRQRYPETVRIMLTGHASIEATMRAVNSGEIYRFFTKPWDDLEIRMAIKSAIEKFDLEEENRRLLQTVKRQSQELKSLEDAYPGISALKRTDQGAYELPDVSEEEIARIISVCNVRN